MVLAELLIMIEIVVMNMPSMNSGDHYGIHFKQ